ncbi:MAG: hypothetical protein M1835_007411 [Candelina submexicana]|nr:MAG: hypothetical protein M1835_007411 [Candelina submexicana]
MSTSQGFPDEQEGSSHALHTLGRSLSGLTIQTPTWAFPSPPTNEPVAPSASAPLPETGSSSSSAPQQPLFNTPARSIFCSGPPTSSLSVNTAQASMSATSPSSSSRPLSALTTPANNTPRRTGQYINGASSIAGRASRIPRAEKDVDDPSTPGGRSTSAERGGNHTPTAVAKLFSAPDIPSRQPSYNRTMSNGYKSTASSETATLPHHLYTRGLLNGRHSDITVHAFGTRYALHRLLLDRAPFFSSALSEPWFESSAKEITLHPEDIDSNITQSAFELALKRLYGCGVPSEEDNEATGLFATGCWLEMADLIDASVESLLRQMTQKNLPNLIKLVTSNYYGKSGERILSSAKAMLCREGWEMPLKYWDGISGDIVREIVAGDGFFVPGEWERWMIAKKILDRRLKARAIESGLIGPDGKPKSRAPDTINFSAIRFDTVYRQDSAVGGRPIRAGDDPWPALYTLPDIGPLLVLLDEGIHYLHLSFEQLQHIRAQRDILGVPLMPEKVITNALWMGMELRQKVVNAKELDMELGLSHKADEITQENVSINPVHDHNTPDTSDTVSTASMYDKGKWVHVEVEDSEPEEIESGSWDGNGQPRKFWIPNIDSTRVMGGTQELLAIAPNPNTASRATGHVSRLSATIDPHDVQWASDFTASIADRPHTPRVQPPGPTPPLCYTHFPPFRFSAEFDNPRVLKEKKRVYSRTVWYAGSMWNVYIQKVRSSKSIQLGVYLHRAKDEKVDGSAGATGSTVDERIGQLERELLVRRTERRARRQQQIDMGHDVEGDTSGSGGDPDVTLVAAGPSTSRPTNFSGLLRGDSFRKASQPSELALSSLPYPAYATGASSEDEGDDFDYSYPTGSTQTLPPYIDGRPAIRTYFKIYSPSKGGRMLSVYESAPDKFNFSQSWGWKSSTMILDDGLMGYDDALRGKDGKLRFMIVIGLFSACLHFWQIGLLILV